MKLLDIKCGIYALTVLSLCSCAHQSSIEPSSAHIDSPVTATETHTGQETLSTTQLSHQTETTNHKPLPVDAPVYSIVVYDTPVDTKFSSTFKLDTAFSSSELRVIDNAGTRITTAAEAPVAIIYSTGKNLRADGENADYEATGGVYQSDVQSRTFDDMLIWITRPLLMYRMVSAGKLAS